MTGMDDHVASRRRAMRLGLAGFAALLAPALPAAAAAARILALRSLHTGEFVRATYWAAGRYVRDGLIEINWLLRDHRSNTVHPIDRRLLDVLDTLRDRLETRVAFEIISGYIDGHARVDHPGAQRYLDPEALCARLAGTVFQLVGGESPAAHFRTASEASPARATGNVFPETTWTSTSSESAARARHCARNQKSCGDDLIGPRDAAPGSGHGARAPHLRRARPIRDSGWALTSRFAKPSRPPAPGKRVAIPSDERAEPSLAQGGVMKVKDVMTKHPITIDAEAPVRTALDVMRTKHIRHLPVLDDTETLIGIITDRDLRHAALAPALDEYLSVRAHRRARQLSETLESLRVKDVMTWAVVTTGPEAPLTYAALIMFESRVGSLPVLEHGASSGCSPSRTC